MRNSREDDVPEPFHVITEFRAPGETRGAGEDDAQAGRAGDLVVPVGRLGTAGVDDLDVERVGRSPLGGTGVSTVKNRKNLLSSASQGPTFPRGPRALPRRVGPLLAKEEGPWNREEVGSNRPLVDNVSSPRACRVTRAVPRMT